MKKSKKKFAVDIINHPKKQFICASIANERTKIITYLEFYTLLILNE